MTMNKCTERKAIALATDAARLALSRYDIRRMSDAEVADVVDTLVHFAVTTATREPAAARELEPDVRWQVEYELGMH
jgi:hypothetical protein